MQAEIKKIEASQTDEKIKTIHERHKENHNSESWDTWKVLLCSVSNESYKKNIKCQL